MTLEHWGQSFGDPVFGEAFLPIPNIVFDGDSLTAVSNSTYPAQVAGGLDSRATITNLGLASQTIVQMEADAAAQVDPLLDSTKRSILIAWGGTNDLFFGATAAATQTAIQTYCANRKAAGWTVILLTILPRSTGEPPTFEADRQTVNAWLRANYTSFADVLVDVGADATIGEAGDSNNYDYYLDLTHLNSTGYAIVAEYVRDAIAPYGGIGHTHDSQYLRRDVGQTIGNANFAAGTNALASRTTAIASVAVGQNALKAVTTGSKNTGVGQRSLEADTTGQENTAVGSEALLANTTGLQNTAVGAYALKANTTSNSNTATGAFALSSTTGGNNVADGVNALRSLTTGASNVAVGENAGYGPALVVANASTTGSNNTLLGAESGQASATQRSNSVAVGYRALYDANNATALGRASQALHANATAVGDSAVTTAANQVQLGASTVTEVRSYGAVKALTGTAIPAGGTAGIGLVLSSVANFGIFFGSGVPTLAAAKGSLYLRSDGSGTGDRAYINTDGGTTWTALTTAL